jgi:hypothetical protein
VPPQTPDHTTNVDTDNTDKSKHHVPNPSSEARTISPGNSLINFLPALEFANELAK